MGGGLNESGGDKISEKGLTLAKGRGGKFASIPYGKKR